MDVKILPLRTTELHAHERNENNYNLRESVILSLICPSKSFFVAAFDFIGSIWEIFAVKDN